MIELEVRQEKKGLRKKIWFKRIYTSFHVENYLANCANHETNVC